MTDPRKIDLTPYLNDIEFDQSIWGKVDESIKKEHSDYEKLIKRITPTREDYQKEFNL